MAVTQSGTKRAASRSGPGGSRRASATSSAQLATISAAATSSQVSQPRIGMVATRPAAQRAAGVRRRRGFVAEVPLPVASGAGTGSRPSDAARNWPV
jgi:hypothetical protein